MLSLSLISSRIYFCEFHQMDYPGILVIKYACNQFWVLSIWDYVSLFMVVIIAVKRVHLLFIDNTINVMLKMFCYFLGRSPFIIKQQINIKFKCHYTHPTNIGHNILGINSFIMTIIATWYGTFTHSLSFFLRRGKILVPC